METKPQTPYPENKALELDEEELAKPALENAETEQERKELEREARVRAIRSRTAAFDLSTKASPE